MLVLILLVFIFNCVHLLRSYIISCGPDGDVRIYHGFDDDDPVSHRIGDVVYCVAYKVKFKNILKLILVVWKDDRQCR